MTDLADADLVVAVVKPSDHLKARAEALLKSSPLRVPFSVGIELLFVARKFAVPCVAFIGATQQHFDVDHVDILLTAAEALDSGDVATVFDAVHVSQALHDGVRLHTSNRNLLASPYPAQAF